MDRKFPRYKEVRTVVLENVELGFCQYATMVNFSGSGLCCKTDMEHNPGNKIFIKMNNGQQKSSGFMREVMAKAIKQINF
jgi:hypothetical protein